MCSESSISSLKEKVSACGAVVGSWQRVETTSGVVWSQVQSALGILGEAPVRREAHEGRPNSTAAPTSRENHLRTELAHVYPPAAATSLSLREQEEGEQQSVEGEAWDR